MKKFLLGTLGVVIIGSLLYFLFVYFATYSNGYRAGELVKFSHKGLIFKTWEGEISQGVSEGQIFKFSVEDHEKELIQQLGDFQGSYVRLTYKERFRTFFWLGESKSFVTKVEKTERNRNYEQ